MDQPKLLKDANDNVLLFLLGRQEGDQFLGGMDVIAHPQLVEKTLATVWTHRPDVRPASGTVSVLLLYIGMASLKKRLDRGYSGSTHSRNGDFDAHLRRPHDQKGRG